MKNVENLGGSEAAKAPIHKAIDRAKELGGIKPETAQVLQKVTIEPDSEKKSQNLGASSEEIKNIAVELPSPAESKQAEAKEVALPELPKIINGEMVFSDKYMQLVRNQIAKDLTDDEFMMYGMMAKRFRLDPLARQITPVVFNARDPEKRRVSYVTTIDGLRLVAHRTGEFDGVSKPTFTRQSNGLPLYCSISVYKKGCTHPFEAEVKFSEYTTGKQLWNPQFGKPETMIAKVAEAHALRKAFPQELSGIYTSDEMEASQQAEKPPMVVMASQKQIAMIMALGETKGKNEAHIHDLIKKAFGIDSMKKLNSGMASAVIRRLQRLPDVIDATEDADALEQMAEEALMQGEPMPPLDLDEIDKGISQRQAA